MSMPPHCATVLSIRFCSSSLRPIWQGITTALPPSARIFCATASHASGLRLEITTVAPCSAMRVAMASPIPLVEPVMIATLPVRSNNDGITFSPKLAAALPVSMLLVGETSIGPVHARAAQNRLPPGRTHTAAASAQRGGDRCLGPCRFLRRTGAVQHAALFRPALSGECALPEAQRPDLLPECAGPAGSARLRGDHRRAGGGRGNRAGLRQGRRGRRDHLRLRLF